MFKVHLKIKSGERQDWERESKREKGEQRGGGGKKGERREFPCFLNRDSFH